MVSSMQQSASDLGSLQSSTIVQLQPRIEQVNATAQSIADLNGQIQNATNAGVSANDLLDQRDQLIMNMTSMVGVTTRAGGSGSVDVYVDGNAIVRGKTVEALGVTVNNNTVTLTWPRIGVTLHSVGGEVGAMVTAVDDTVPRYLASLDGLASKLISVVNAAHQQGSDLEIPPSAPTETFFTGTNLSDMAVNQALLDDPLKIAAASSTAGGLDGSVAQAIADIGASTMVDDPANPGSLIRSPDADYQSLITALGVESQRASDKVDIQSQITSQVDAARQADFERQPRRGNGQHGDVPARLRSRSQVHHHRRRDAQHAPQHGVALKDQTCPLIASLSRPSPPTP